MFVSHGGHLTLIFWEKVRKTKTSSSSAICTMCISYNKTNSFWKYCMYGSRMLNVWFLIMSSNNNIIMTSSLWRRRCDIYTWFLWFKLEIYNFFLIKFIGFTFLEKVGYKKWFRRQYISHEVRVHSLTFGKVSEKWLGWLVIYFKTPKIRVFLDRNNVFIEAFFLFILLITFAKFYLLYCFFYIKMTLWHLNIYLITTQYLVQSYKSCLSRKV